MLLPLAVSGWAVTSQGHRCSGSPPVAGFIFTKLDLPGPGKCRTQLAAGKLLSSSHRLCCPSPWSLVTPAPQLVATFMLGCACYPDQRQARPLHLGCPQSVHGAASLAWGGPLLCSALRCHEAASNSHGCTARPPPGMDGRRQSGGRVRVRRSPGARRQGASGTHPGGEGRCEEVGPHMSRGSESLTCSAVPLN